MSSSLASILFSAGLFSAASALTDCPNLPDLCFADSECVTSVGAGSTCTPVGPPLDFLTGDNGCCTALAAATTTSSTGTSTTNCVDKINRLTGTSDCPLRANFCNNPVYRTRMTQQCPKTCGRCSSGFGTGSTSCVDFTNPVTGVSDCPKRSYLCNNAVYLTLMAQQCPKTCGRCTGSTGTGTGTGSSTSCVDLKNPMNGVSDCPQRRHLCSNAMYQSLMRQQCPATCGFCSGK